MKTYQLTVANNNVVDTFGPFTSKRDATKERTRVIQAYGYNKSKGFTRESYDNLVIFHHAIYSTVVMEIVTV